MTRMARNCDENHSTWLTKMKFFCEELELYLGGFSYDESSIAFPKSVPANKNGEFDHLCEMSTQCAYVSGIDTHKHDVIIFEIQSMARKLLVEIGRHPTMAFLTGQRDSPFFEKTLLIAISLAVEHQMHTIDTHGMHKNGSRSYLPRVKTRCS
jgi:hypothetical protein